MKAHERRPSGGDEEKMVPRKQKAAESKGKNNKKVKSDDNNGKSSTNMAIEFDKFCKKVIEHLSIEQMRGILEANGQDSSAADDAVVPTCQDVLFYGPLDKCPICGNKMKCKGSKYTCEGAYSEWSTCTFTTKDPPRKEAPVRFPDFGQDFVVPDFLKIHEVPKTRPETSLSSTDKPFEGMVICLPGRLSHPLKYWRSEIEKHGGQVANSVIGASCLVVSPAEREQGGSSKVAEAVDRGISVVREAWLTDSIENQEPQPLDAYDVLTDLLIHGKGIPWDQQDPSQEVKVYGKRGVHKDTQLQEQGGSILEKDGLLYNCALSVSDAGRRVNEYCVMQLITVPDKNVHLYYKKGRIGDDARAEERFEEWEDVDSAVEEFAKLFEELTGNEFEPWEREKKFEKKPQMFFIVDMDHGCDVRHGGLGLRQLGITVAHSNLDPMVANLMNVLYSREIYRYALIEMGHDAPDLPMAMLSDLHLKRCEELILLFIDKIKSMRETGQRAEAVWSDFSQRWFTMMHSTRPFIFRDYQDIADHATAVLESVRDIKVASNIIGDMSGSTIDDPLFEGYKRLGCLLSVVEKDSDDYKMIAKYLEKTYEPYKVGEISYGVSIENVFAVEASACPSYDEIKKLPNKVLLWCGTRSANLLRHLNKGFLPAVCSLPVPGYMFGRAIVCSDAAAEAARYGFTAVDRPEGFLILAVASLGQHITEIASPPQDTKSLEEKKDGVKGHGRKKTDESEHFVWKDGIKVPCGKLVPSENIYSALEYNEYAVYDPKQVSIRFLVGVKFEEKDVEYDSRSERCCKC